MLVNMSLLFNAVKASDLIFAAQNYTKIFIYANKNEKSSGKEPRKVDSRA